MDTKALERALNLVLENDVLCASYGGVFREAAAELAELKDLAISWQARWDTCDKERMKLRAELDEARKVITSLVEIVCSGGAPALGELNPSENLAADYYQRVANIIENTMVPWLEAHPEETIRQLRAERDEARKVIQFYANLSGGATARKYLKAHPERRQ